MCEPRSAISSVLRVAADNKLGRSKQAAASLSSSASASADLDTTEAYVSNNVSALASELVSEVVMSRDVMSRDILNDVILASVIDASMIIDSDGEGAPLNSTVIGGGHNRDPYRESRYDQTPL